MDRCGTLLLRDVPSDDRGTLSDFKEVFRRNREINMSDCPGCVLELLETGELNASALNRDERRELQEFLNGISKEEQPLAKGKKKHRETRFDRINRLKSLYPGGRLTTVVVDTDNRFLYNGRRFELDRSLEQYSPRHTRYGDQYDMDRVMVIKCDDGSLFFADQDGASIDGSYVYDLGEVN